MNRQAYETDLTDKQWEQIASFSPKRPQGNAADPGDTRFEK